MLNRLMRGLSPSETAGTKSEPVHIFFTPAEAKSIADRYSGVFLSGQTEANQSPSSSPQLSSQATTDTAGSRRGSEASVSSEPVVIDVDGRSHSPDSPTVSEHRGSIKGDTPGEFYQDFSRGLYSFYDLTEGGALQEQKLTLASDDPQAMIDGLKPYFGSEMRAKQSQRIGQGFAMGVLPYLRTISDREPCKPDFHIEFIRVQGETPRGSRIYVRFLTVHDTLVDSSSGLAFFAEQPTKTMEVDRLKTLQNEMRSKNKGKPLSGWAFCSVDEIYELIFTDSVRQGPDFLCVELPILSIYNYTFYPETRAAEFAKTKAESPKGRLEVVLKKLASKRLKIDFSKPILTEEKSTEDEKLSTKAKVLRMLDISLSGQCKRGFGTLCDHMQIDTTIRQHIKDVFRQIQDNPIPSDELFIQKLKNHKDESVFDSEGNLQVWVQQALSTSSAIHMKGFSDYLTSIFTIARKGIQKEDGELHAWLDPHFGTDTEQKLEPKKSRLTQAREKLGKDLLNGCLMTSLALRLSSIPLSRYLPVLPTQIALVTMRLVEHQNALNTEFLDEDKKLTDLFVVQSQNDFCQLPEFKALLTQIQAAKRTIPLGDTGRLILLIKLATKILELELQSDSIAYFYAVEKFKEQVRDFDKVKLTAVQVRLEEKDKPTKAMREFTAEMFTHIQDVHNGSNFIKNIRHKIEPPERKKRRSNKNQQGIKNQDEAGEAAQPNKTIKHLSLTYALAMDSKNIDFATEMFSLMEQEESLSMSGSEKLLTVFYDAIKEYQKLLADSAANPGKFTPLLKLINNILKLDADAIAYLLPKLNEIIDEFNKIKNDSAKVAEFNVFVDKLIQNMPSASTHETESESLSAEEQEERAKQGLLQKRFEAFIFAYDERYRPVALCLEPFAAAAAGSPAQSPALAEHADTTTSSSCCVYLKILAGLTLVGCAVALWVLAPQLFLYITLPQAKLAAGALGVAGVGLFSRGGCQYLSGPGQAQPAKIPAPA